MPPWKYGIVDLGLTDAFALAATSAAILFTVGGSYNFYAVTFLTSMDGDTLSRGESFVGDTPHVLVYVSVQWIELPGTFTQVAGAHYFICT